MDLSLQNVTVSRDEWTAEYDFSLQRGRWMSVIGPSGSGKSTLLEVIAGFCRPASGSVWLGEKRIDGLRPGQRRIAYVFQKNSLFPHLLVGKNLDLALHDAGLSARERRVRVGELMELVRLPESYLLRYPGDVSGGELARLNVVRALLRPADLLLLDEPFASLDESLRLEINCLVWQLHETRELTTICVTHQQEDALLFADAVMVLEGGQVRAYDDPARVVVTPPSPVVGDFLRSGTLVEMDGVKYFIAPHELTTNREKASTFLQCRRIIISRFRVGHAGTHINVVDLDKRSVYRLAPGEIFSGEMFFDASKCVTFTGY